jgi:hypothetical protein
MMPECCFLCGASLEPYQRGFDVTVAADWEIEPGSYARFCRDCYAPHAPRRARRTLRELVEILAEAKTTQRLGG